MIITLLLVGALAISASAEGLKFGSQGTVAFAGVTEARTILTNRDEFIRALSPFERAARLKSDQPVSENDFLSFVGQSALTWNANESNQMAQAVQAVGGKLAPWRLPFPAKILLIKTTGREEGNAAYTRQHAVIIPAAMAHSSAASLERLLAHEFFHVLSRSSPDLRKALYRIIGYSPINQIELPTRMRSRRLTNPDGVQNGWMITVTNASQAYPVVSILYANADHYDAGKPGEFFEYLVFKLMAVENVKGRWQPKLMNGEPCLFEPEAVSGFYEQIGRNTSYIIHPDEILADNFVSLIHAETNLATPRIVEEMDKVFATSSKR